MPTPKTPAAPRNTEEHLVRQAIGHLRGLVDILGPCEHFDHHGYCHTHFIESPCRVGKAREFLDSMPNARPHDEERIGDSVQADVGPTFSTGKYRGYVCDGCGEEFPHETSRDVHFRRAQRGLGCRANASNERRQEPPERTK